jgi:hypothetical protein
VRRSKHGHDSRWVPAEQVPQTPHNKAPRETQPAVCKDCGGRLGKQEGLLAYVFTQPLAYMPWCSSAGAAPVSGAVCCMKCSYGVSAPYTVVLIPSNCHVM